MRQRTTLWSVAPWVTAQRSGARGIDRTRTIRPTLWRAGRRAPPLALWHQGTGAELVEAAHLQSLPTHAHPRSLAACALLSLTLRRILDHAMGPDRALEDAAAGWRTTTPRALSSPARCRA